MHDHYIIFKQKLIATVAIVVKKNHIGNACKIGQTSFYPEFHGVFISQNHFILRPVAPCIDMPYWDYSMYNVP